MKRFGFTLALLVVAFSDANAQSGPLLRAQFNPSTSVADLSWPAIAGATQYRLSIATTFPAWSTFVTTPLTSYPVAIPASAVRLFQVTPLNSGGAPVGNPSNVALVSSYSYAETVAVGMFVKDEHITELRTIAAAIRSAAGVGAPSWTYSVGALSPIHAADITDLRTAFNGALANLSVPLPVYDDSSLANQFPRRVHVQQLRDLFRAYPDTSSATSAVSNAYFSPNGDGAKDTTNFTATISAGTSSRTDFRWGVNVRNASGTMLRNVIGIGAAVGYVWNGTDGANVVQPNGTYTFELYDRDALNGILATNTAQIDLTPPTASITAPTEGATVSNVRQNGSGSATVVGSATDNGAVESWNLLRTGNAQSDQQISSGTTAVSAATLGTWQTMSGNTPIANGTYVLRLTVTDRAGNVSIANRSVIAGNFSMSQSVYQANLSTSETVSYSSTVPFSLTQTITIETLSGQIVRTLVNQVLRGSGNYNDVWDGRNDQAQLVPDGPYRAFATLTDGPYTYRWDLNGDYLTDSPQKTQLNYPMCVESNGTQVPCSEATSMFDPFTAKPLVIRYCVGGGDPPNCTGSRPALVIGQVANSVEVSSVCSSGCIFSEYQASGAREVKWFGYDLFGSYVAAAPYLAVIRQHDLISKNMIVLYGTAPSLTNLTISPMLFNPDSAPAPLAGQQFAVDVTTYAGRQVSLKAEFRNLQSNSILRTVTTALSAAGHLTLTWNGRADNDAWVAPGTYEVILTATDSAGSFTRLKPLVVVRY